MSKKHTEMLKQVLLGGQQVTGFSCPTTATAWAMLLKLDPHKVRVTLSETSAADRDAESVWRSRAAEATRAHNRTALDRERYKRLYDMARTGRKPDLNVEDLVTNTIMSLRGGLHSCVGRQPLPPICRK